MKTHTTTTYDYDELTEEAQRKAVETYAAACARTWDSVDTESVEEAILYTLAEALQSPGWDTYGAGDFPGIDGLIVESWDVGHGTLTVSGTLTPTNAPALPWSDGAIGAPLYAGSIDYVDGYCEDAYDVMREAWANARDRAIAAGRSEHEYMLSEERAQQQLEDGFSAEFLEDGTFYSF